MVMDKNNETVLFGLSKSLFWDVDPTKIKPIKHASYIIEKVLTIGTWDEFKKTLDYYGKGRVAEYLTHFRYMDRIVLAFCSTYFQIPQSKFRCYSQRRLKKTCWDY
jgi:hypothetical protein